MLHDLAGVRRRRAERTRGVGRCALLVYRGLYLMRYKHSVVPKSEQKKPPLLDICSMRAA